MFQGLHFARKGFAAELSCTCMVQALFGELPEDIKVAAEMKGHVALLKLAGAEPALQLAQLVAPGAPAGRHPARAHQGGAFA